MITLALKTAVSVAHCQCRTLSWCQTLSQCQKLLYRRVYVYQDFNRMNTVSLPNYLFISTSLNLLFHVMCLLNASSYNCCKMTNKTCSIFMYFIHISIKNNIFQIKNICYFPHRPVLKIQYLPSLLHRSATFWIANISPRLLW